MSVKPWIAILTALTLNGCATVSPGSDTFCGVYEPVYTTPILLLPDDPGNHFDTRETIDAVTRNNAVYLDQCVHDQDKGPNS